MQKTLALIVFAFLFALSLGSISLAAHSNKVPARVHFSGNLEGEIEPCG